MGKSVGTAEAKAHLIRLIDEVERTGEAVTITKRGKPRVQLVPVKQVDPASIFGFLKGKITVNGDLDDPIDPHWEAEWEANNPPELYR